MLVCAISLGLFPWFRSGERKPGDFKAEQSDRSVQIDRVKRNGKEVKLQVRSSELPLVGGPMRAIFESLGVADVVTKSVGTSNPYNMIRATFEALKEQTSPRSVAQRRGKKVSDLLGGGGASTAEADAQAEAIVE